MYVSYKNENKLYTNQEEILGDGYKLSGDILTILPKSCKKISRYNEQLENNKFLSQNTIKVFTMIKLKYFEWRDVMDTITINKFSDFSVESIQNSIQKAILQSLMAATDSFIIL